MINKIKNMNRWLNGTAFLWIVTLSIMLLYNLNNAPLWQDEAESALNALTISWDSPIPKGASNGEIALLHEMALYYKINDPKYEYLPTHFMYTPYVTIHGWVPYYFIRSGIEIFGKNEFGPRFFSVVFFALSLAVLYLLLLNRLPRGWAFCVIAYCSLMPTMLGYAMQVRWYSYSLFFSICGLYSFLFFVETKSRLAFAAWVISQAMLYYTFTPAFIVQQVAFILFLVISRRDCLKFFIPYGIILFAAVLPHIILTKFPLLALKIPAKHTIDLQSLFTMLCILEWNPFIVFSAMIFAVTFVMRTLRNKLWRGADSAWRFDFLILLFIFCGFLILSFTSTIVSFYPRIFIVLVAMVVYCAFSALFPKDGERRIIVYLKAITLALMVIFLIISPQLKSGSSRITDLFAKEFRQNQDYTAESKWVRAVVKLIESRNAQNPLILTSFNHYVFKYYYNYDAELIWPLRKDFIDSTNRHLFIIVEENKDLLHHCEIFLPEQKEQCKKMETMKFYDRIQGCKKINVSGVWVFDCPKKI